MVALAKHMSHLKSIITIFLLSPVCTFRGIENIQAGIGTQAGLVIRDLSIFVGGIFSAFIINWKLALVVFTLFPVLSLLGGLNLRVRTCCMSALDQ